MAATLVHSMGQAMTTVCNRHMKMETQNNTQMGRGLVVILVKLQIGMCGKSEGNNKPATGRLFCLGVKMEKWMRIA